MEGRKFSFTRKSTSSGAPGVSLRVVSYVADFLSRTTATQAIGSLLLASLRVSARRRDAVQQAAYTPTHTWVRG